MPNNIVFETERLIIRKSEPCESDINLIHCLWTEPEIMKYVGFPFGLKTTKDELSEILSSRNEGSFGDILIVVTKENRTSIGQCLFHKPDEHGVCETDIKLLLEFQSMGYGSELKSAMVEYLFTNTDCKGLKATPNKLNMKSVKMQEKIGFKKIGEKLHHFPHSLKEQTTAVEYCIYYLSREDYEKSRHSFTDL